MIQEFEEIPERNQVTSNARQNKTIPHVHSERGLTGLPRVNRDYF